MLRLRLTTVFLALAGLAAACGDDSSNVDYPPFPNPTGKPDATPRPDGPPGAPATPLINEIAVNDDNADDTDFAEAFGDPSTDYSAYTLIGLEGDSVSNEGSIDFVFPLGTSTAGGYLTSTPGGDDIDQGSATYLIVLGFTGALLDDLDTDDDGTLDVALPWASAVDAVAFSDGGAQDSIYTAGFGTTVPVITHDSVGADANGGWARIPNGADTDVLGDWLPLDLDAVLVNPGPGAAARTPDAANTEGT